MTNQQYLATVSVDDCYEIINWVMHDYGRRYTNTPMAVKSWLHQEAICGEWQKVQGYVTAGGDPVYKCPHCGQDEHVYGIEHPSGKHKVCEYCGCFNMYPMR